MDKQAYEDAMTTIVAADKDTLNQLVSAINPLKTALDEVRAGVKALGDQYAGMTGPAGNAQSVVNTISSQLSMLDYTVTNITTTAANAVAAYSPAPNPEGA